MGEQGSCPPTAAARQRLLQVPGEGRRTAREASHGIVGGEGLGGRYTRGRLPPSRIQAGWAPGEQPLRQRRESDPGGDSQPGAGGVRPLRCRDTRPHFTSDCARSDHQRTAGSSILRIASSRDGDPGQGRSPSFPVAEGSMGHIFAAFSPCELTEKDRHDAERMYPGLRFPDEGRLPSRLDIEAALKSHSDWQVELDTGKDWWTAFIRSPILTASLRVDHYSGDPARPHSFHFDTGDPDLVIDV